MYKTYNNYLLMYLANLSTDLYSLMELKKIFESIMLVLDETETVLLLCNSC